MKYLTLASLLLIAAMASQYIYAEQSENQKTGNHKTRTQQPEMQEVVVTASFQPIQLKQSASAITVISAKDIENSHATMVSDLLRDVPGLAVSRSGVLGSTTQLRVRGSEGNHVLVMIDGIEVNDSSQGDEFNWAHLPTTGIERIEIVRGPQSVLWGSNAVAGVVNIITQKTNKPLQLGAYSEMGNRGTHHTGFNLGGSGNNYQVNLNGSHVSTEGENISRRGDEDDSYRNTTINLNMGWQPLDNLSFSLVGRQTKGENEFDGLSFVTGLPEDADNESEVRQRFGKVQADLSLFEGHWDQRVALSVSRHGNENFTDDVLTGSTSSRKKQYSYLSTINWAEETQSLSFLAERETENFSQRGPISFGSDPSQDQSRKTDSLALEYRITLWDNLTLGASVRHDDNTEFENANTRRFEASYRLPSTGTRLRAAYGTGVKNPTFIERFGFSSSAEFSVFQGNSELDPEESKSWEVGVDQAFLGGDVLVGLTYFNARLENQINGFVSKGLIFHPVSMFMVPLYTAENLDGTSDRQGVEATFDAKLTPALSAKASYTYTDTTQPNEATGRDVDEVRRARHIGSASLNWQATNQLNVNLNAQYNGSQNDNFFPPPLYAATPVKLDDYTLLNLAASYQMNKQLSFYTRLDNILDDDYEEIFGFQSLGFNAVVGVRYNFAP